MADQRQRIDDPHLLSYPIPYMIDSGKVEIISVYASMERVKILSWWIQRLAFETPYKLRRPEGSRRIAWLPLWLSLLSATALAGPWPRRHGMVWLSASFPRYQGNDQFQPRQPPQGDHRTGKWRMKFDYEFSKFRQSWLFTWFKFFLILSLFPASTAIWREWVRKISRSWTNARESPGKSPENVKIPLNMVFEGNCFATR